MAHNPTPTPLNPLVPVHLAEILPQLAAVRASVPAGCMVWFLADMAHQAIRRALKELDTAGRALDSLNDYQGGNGHA